MAWDIFTHTPISSSSTLGKNIFWPLHLALGWSCQSLTAQTHYLMVLQRNMLLCQWEAWSSRLLSFNHPKHQLHHWNHSWLWFWLYCQPTTILCSSEPAKSPKQFSPETAYITADSFSIELGNIPLEATAASMAFVIGILNKAASQFMKLISYLRLTNESSSSICQ